MYNWNVDPGNYYLMLPSKTYFLVETTEEYIRAKVDWYFWQKRVNVFRFSPSGISTNLLPITKAVHEHVNFMVDATKRKKWSTIWDDLTESLIIVDHDYKFTTIFTVHCEVESPGKYLQRTYRQNGGN